MKHTMAIAGAAFALLMMAHNVGAQEKQLLNLDRNGVAVQGYDPVAFFTDGKPVKGNSNIRAQYAGAIYQFASEENRQRFEAEPNRYAPQFGGYCAYAVSRGRLASIEVDAFQIVGGRLLLQYDKDIRDRFNADTTGNLAKADAEWPGLVGKKGR